MKAREVLPGVYHLTDAMGVCMTLFVGEKKAVLLDTGYGMENVAEAVRDITRLPLQVILTHGHHDHALGAKCFPDVFLLAEDLPVYAKYTNPFWTQRVVGQANGKGVPVPDGYVDRPVAAAHALTEQEMDLGGLHLRFVPCPGHTPGSLVVWVPDRALLVTGDNWNPTTWVWFREALDVFAYRNNLQSLLKLPFTHVLCSHDCRLFDRTWIEDFAAALTDAAILAAVPCPEGQEQSIDTVCLPMKRDMHLVFDRQKAREARGNG